MNARRSNDSSLIGKPVAVIEIGSSSIRMMVASIDKTGHENIMDFLSQTLMLGNNTFTTGSIPTADTEECIKALRHFKAVLDEYGIVDRLHIRVVATTAVREAFNREAFSDRVFIATGFQVEILDEVDIARLMYLSWRSNFSREKDYSRETIIVEVGGGNTDLLHMSSGQVDSAQTYRLGSLRLRKSIEAAKVSIARQRELIEAQVRQTVDQICRRTTVKSTCRIIGLGGDMRFAMDHAEGSEKKKSLQKLSLEDLRELVDKLLSMSVNETALHYHITFSDAETLGPSLLFYLRLAEAFCIKFLSAGDVSIRHGMLIELARSTTWAEDFRDQVLLPALEVGRKYQFDESHGMFVAKTSSTIFKALVSEHKLDSRWELVLHVSALLHDIGTYISTRSHHKHSMYIIRNTELFGFTRQDILIAALVARYHRHSTPRPVHEGYSDLPRDERLIVGKLAAILRVADSLDSARKQRLKGLECRIENGTFVVSSHFGGDTTLERLSISAKGTYFTEIYGLPIVLKAGDRS